jgi:hypothetical protein
MYTEKEHIKLLNNMKVKTGPNTNEHNLHTFLWNNRDTTDPPKCLKLSQFFPQWM